MESQSSNQELLCCRVCLLTDCKLYNIRENKLAEAFTRLSGTPVYKDRLPQYVCAYCHTLLQKSIVFRQKCLQTMMRLMPMLQEGEVTTDTIREMDRESHQFFNLGYTAVQTVECVEPSLNIKVEPNEIDQSEDEIDEDEAIKDEIDILDSYLDEGVDEATTNVIDTGEPNIYEDDLQEQDNNIIQNAGLELELNIDKDVDCVDNEVDAYIEKNKTTKRKNDAMVEIEIEPSYDANRLKNAKSPEKEEQKKTINIVESSIGDNAKSNDNFGTANTSDTVLASGVNKRSRRRKGDKEGG